MVQRSNVESGPFDADGREDGWHVLAEAPEDGMTLSGEVRGGSFVAFRATDESGATVPSVLVAAFESLSATPKAARPEAVERVKVPKGWYMCYSDGKGPLKCYPIKQRPAGPRA